MTPLAPQPRPIANFKNTATAKSAVAAGIRSAYAPLFASNESADKLSSDKLKGLVAQVAGTDEGMTARIVSTFNTLAKLADFSATGESPEQPADKDEGEGERSQDQPKPTGKGLRPEFHYNLQIHLPANGSEEVYLNIFNALRKVFQ